MELPICNGTYSNRLSDCVCACRSYCSKKCSKADKVHTMCCFVLEDIAKSYSACYTEDLPSSLTDDSVCEKFSLVSSFKGLLPPVSPIYTLTIQLTEVQKRLSYHMSLLYALQSLPGRRIGPDHLPWRIFSNLKSMLSPAVPSSTHNHGSFLCISFQILSI